MQFLLELSYGKVHPVELSTYEYNKTETKQSWILLIAAFKNLFGIVCVKFHINNVMNFLRNGMVCVL